MADITLEKPKAGEHITVEAHAGARFIVKFDTAEATPKKDGVNFIFTFEDGSSITITNFYGQPQSSLPEFQCFDTLIPAEEFFARLENSEMPPVLSEGAFMPTEPMKAAIPATPLHATDIWVEDEYFDMLASHEHFFSLNTEDSPPMQAQNLDALSEQDLFARLTLCDIFMDSQTYVASDDNINGQEQDLTVFLDQSSAHVELMTLEALTPPPATTAPLAAEDVAPISLVVLGKTLQGQDTQEMLEALGVSRNSDGSMHLQQGWQSQTPTDATSRAEYTQYTHEETDTVILVHQTLLINT